MAVTIKKETLDFLKQLKKNNNREWFEKNKDKYEAARVNFTDLIGELIVLTGAFDPSVKHLTPKDCIFRIYRDTRFAKDKTPYKNFFGAHLIGGDKNSGVAGYYFHFEPGNSFLAGGVHGPEPDRLKGLRQEISYNAAAFKKIINDKTFKANFGEVTGERLKTVPKGFDKEDPMMPYLQMKEFLMSHEVDDKTLLATDYTKYCAKIFKSMVPFNAFVNAPVKSA